MDPVSDPPPLDPRLLPPDHPTASSPTEDKDDSKRNRACEPCRTLKVRCDHDPQRPHLPCQRCQKANRQCVVTEPSRKRRKRSDMRVAELERKLDYLTAAMHARQPVPSFIPPHPPPVPYTLPALANVSVGTPPSRHSFQHTQTARSSISLHNSYSTTPDTVQRAAPAPAPAPPPVHASLDPSLDNESANRCSPGYIIARINDIVDKKYHAPILDRFVNHMAPRLPAIVIAPGTTPSDLLQDRPILFLCILLAGCAGIVSPEVHRQLWCESIDTLADCVMRTAKKSLEIIQALIVHILWYNPAQVNLQHGLYHYAQAVGCMALDIGLGRRSNPNTARRGFGAVAKDLHPVRSLVDSESIESRRTWLACYYVSASAARIRRRPKLLRCTRFSEECMDFLERSPDAAPSDRLLVQYVRMQKIADEITEAFCMDDASAPAVSIKDPKVLYCIEAYEKKLNDWKERLPEELKGAPGLMFLYEGMQIYLHEVAMHVDHNVDDFRIPFTEESLRSGSQYSESLTQQQMSALGACLGASHRVLEIFCSFDTATRQFSPAVFCLVECSYALVVLMKLHLAASQPASEMAKFISLEDVAALHWIDQLCTIFETMASVNMSAHITHKAAKIVTLARGWLLSHRRENGASKASELLVAASEGGQSTYDGLQMLSEAATADARRSNAKEAPYSYQPQSSHVPGPGLDLMTHGFIDQQGIDWLAFPEFDGLLTDGMQGLDWITGDGLEAFR